MDEYEKYTVRITKGEFEGEECFRAIVTELPDIAEYADTYEEAYELARDSIETTAQIFQEKGRTLPEAQADVEDYSGRVTLRISKSLHKSLADNAVREGVSLNQHLVTLLSGRSGYQSAKNRLDTWRRPTSETSIRPTKKGKVTPFPLKAVVNGG